MKDAVLRARISARLLERLDRVLARKGLSRSEWLVSQVSKYVDEEEEKTVTKRRHILDVPVKLACGCETVWHEGETLCPDAYAWCDRHEDTHVVAILDPAWWRAYAAELPEPASDATIALTNPWTGATLDLDPAQVTQAKLDAMAELMDDTVRELVHRELAPCSPGEFFRRYAQLVGPTAAGALWFS